MSDDHEDGGGGPGDRGDDEGAADERDGEERPNAAGNGVAPGDDGRDPTDDDAAAAGSFDAELRSARAALSADDITAFHVGVLHEDESVDVSFGQAAGDPRREGVEALALLAAHVRAVASQAGTDIGTVADDAVDLARAVSESDDPGAGEE